MTRMTVDHCALSRTTETGRTITIRRVTKSMGSSLGTRLLPIGRDRALRWRGNRSSGNIQNPMTGEDRELGNSVPFRRAITRWQYRFGSGLGIGCAVFMSCLLRTNSGFADRVLTTLV